MTRISKNPVLVAVVSALAFLALGATAASAHGRPGPGGPGGASVSKLVTEGAKQLGVPRTTLTAAIQNAAAARIDEAVADEDLTADQAEDLKQEAQDNLNVAYELSRTAKVASNLGVTTDKLNDAFKDARRALALAQVDKAQAAGKIDADEAADLKAKINKADLPGYKAARGLGFGPGAGGHGGRGGGPAFGTGALGRPALGAAVFGVRHR